MQTFDAYILRMLYVQDLVTASVVARRKNAHVIIL
jgi:hypothetical protein